MISRPTFLVWLISTIIAVAVIVLKYTTVSLPVVTELVAGRQFEFLLGAYVLMWLGTVLKGL